MTRRWKERWLLLQLWWYDNTRQPHKANEVWRRYMREVKHG